MVNEQIVEEAKTRRKLGSVLISSYWDECVFWWVEMQAGRRLLETCDCFVKGRCVRAPFPEVDKPNCMVSSNKPSSNLSMKVTSMFVKILIRKTCMCAFPHTRHYFRLWRFKIK